MPRGKKAQQQPAERAPIKRRRKSFSQRELPDRERYAKEIAAHQTKLAAQGRVIKSLRLELAATERFADNALKQQAAAEARMRQQTDAMVNPPVSSPLKPWWRAEAERMTAPGAEEVAPPSTMLKRTSISVMATTTRANLMQALTQANAAIDDLDGKREGPSDPVPPAPPAPNGLVDQIAELRTLSAQLADRVDVLRSRLVD